MASLNLIPIIWILYLATAGTTSERPPHIVLIVADDLVSKKIDTVFI